MARQSGTPFWQKTVPSYD
jgi:hypothetical protein